MKLYKIELEIESDLDLNSFLDPSLFSKNGAGPCARSNEFNFREKIRRKILTTKNKRKLEEEIERIKKAVSEFHTLEDWQLEDLKILKNKGAIFHRITSGLGFIRVSRTPVINRQVRYSIIQTTLVVDDYEVGKHDLSNHLLMEALYD